MSAALSITAFDHTTSQLTITGHGLHTGDGPGALWNVGGVLPVGLAPVTDVFVINVDANTLKLAASSTLAFANTPLTFADNGTGTSTLLIGVPYRRPRTYAQGVRIASADLNANFDAWGSFAWPFLTGQPQGLLDGPTFSGPLVVGGQLLPFADFTFTAAGSSAVLTAANHPLHTGTGPIRGSNSGGGLPGSFPAATDLWAIKLSSSTFSVATSQANAIAGIAITMSTAGTGTQTLNHQPTTTRISDATVSRNLTVGGTVTGALGVVATTGAHVTVSGTGRFVHGTRTLPLHSAAFQGLAGVAVTKNGLTATYSGANAVVSAPISLPSGKRITAIRLFFSDNATGSTQVTALLCDDTVTTPSQLVVGTSSPSAGTGAQQTLTISSLAIDVTAGHAYDVEVKITNGSATVAINSGEVDYVELAI